MMAVALVATALCADRVAVAAPVNRPQVSEMAGRLVNRLTVGLRRVMPAVRLHEARQEGAAAYVAVLNSCLQPSISARQSFSPFQFRLPPPLV